MSRDAMGQACGDSQLYHLNADNTLALMYDLSQRVATILIALRQENSAHAIFLSCCLLYLRIPKF